MNKFSGLTNLKFFLIFLLPQLALAQSESVVEILRDGQPVAHGVLISIDKDRPVVDGWIGIVATAYHVVDGADAIGVQYTNGRRGRQCKVLETDQNLDVALLSVWVPAGIAAAPISDRSIRPGDGLRYFCSREIVAGIASAPTDDDRVFADLTLRAGDSGGPVANDAGQIVGVISGGWFWYGPPVSRRTTWPARSCNLPALQRLIDRASDNPVPTPSN